MQFDWDDAKAAANYAKHRVEFAYAARIFLDPHCVIAEDTRKAYGESRYNAMGMIENRLYVVSFTMRGAKHRIISARKGNGREQKKYHYFHP